MAFLDKAGLQTLTNKLVQGDAIKVASSRGYTVKNVIDNITRECSDVENPQTMALEDETGHFLIGKGKDIDVSGDVEAGKMAFGFKGRTVVSASPNQTYYLACSETDRPLITGLVQEQNYIKFEVTKKRSSWCYVDCGRIKNLAVPIKTNTKYTIVADILKGVKGISIRDGNGLAATTEEVPVVNNRAIISIGGHIASPEGNIVYLHLTSEPVSVEVKNLMLLEGDWTNKELPPFFTGIKSSFETEEERKIVHTGKNLWKWGDPTRFAQYTRTFSEPFMLAGHTYTISHGNITQYFSPDNTPNIRFASINGELKNIHFRGEPIVFTPKEDVKDVIIYSNGYNWAGSTGKFATIENFQIEEGRGATEYAPYTKEEKVVELEEPLRSLPYGACDESTEDGKLIRRIGVCSLVDIENWNSWGAEYVHSDMIGAYSESFKDIKTNYGLERSPALFCDKLLVGTRAELSSRNTSFICRGGYYIGVAIRKDQLETPDQQGLMKWIEKNSPIVYYETTERTTSVAKTLFNTSQRSKIDISSAIAPITTYKAPLNRVAQIDNSIKTIQELKQRIELLEQAYDNHFLESQYKLSLLKLEHQIESEEI